MKTIKILLTMLMVLPFLSYADNSTENVKLFPEPHKDARLVNVTVINFNEHRVKCFIDMDVQHSDDTIAIIRIDGRAMSKRYATLKTSPFKIVCVKDPLI